MEKQFLTAAQILDVNDLQVVDVEVPEWGGFVKIRSLSGEEIVKYTENAAKGNNIARIVALSAVNEDGSPLFTEEDVKRLQRKSMKALIRLQEVALRINGLSEEEKTQTKNA